MKNPSQVPSYCIDPATLPPPILTSEPGSFAHDTLRRRIPAILQEVIDCNPGFDAGVRRALDELYAELTGGCIREFRDDAPDVAFWNEVSVSALGRSWLDVPWYWAESAFFRRVLEATGYFRPDRRSVGGRWQGVDPYLAKKRTEWVAAAAPATIEALLADLPDEPAGRFERLFHASLWGNRTDLSYTVAAHLGGTANSHAERENVLVDDTMRVWGYLTPQPPLLRSHTDLRRGGKIEYGPDRGGAPSPPLLATVVSSPGEGEANCVRWGVRLVVIADNAGTELLADLALVDFLLGTGLASEISLHLKPQPFFVSDAMAADVHEGIAALPAGGPLAAQLAQRLNAFLEEGRLRLATHWAYATCLFYFQMPADLRGELAAADLVLAKGDVNYRRLLGDAHWPHTTPFEQAVGYFPAPLVSLRTLKGEIIVGLAAGQAERLAAEDAGWLVNGRRGVIQGLRLA